MIETILKNIAYTYYPKEIDAMTEKEDYVMTVEFNRLLDTINDIQKNEGFQKSYDSLIIGFNSHNSVKNIKDVSVLDWLDRCISFELDIVQGNELIKICLNISLIVPYYIVYLLKNDIEVNPYKWLTLPKRDRELEASEYGELITQISSIVEKNTHYNKFPESIGKIILPDISFGEVVFGDFSLYNAFFLDENKL